MISEEALSVFRGYSNAFEPFDLDLCHAWMTNDVRGRCGVVAEEVGGREDLDAGLVRVIAEARGSLRTFEDVWHPSLGVLRSVPDDAARAARHFAELALHLHGLGAPGEWSIRLPHESRFAFDRWLLPPCEEMRVRADGSRLDVCGRGAAGAVRRRWGRTPAGEWLSLDGRMPDAEEVQEGIRLFPWPLRREEDQEEETVAPGPGLVARCREGFRQLAEVCRPYAEWVERVTRVVVPLAPREDHIASWSSRDYPSMLAMDCNGHVTDVSETLIHEASHQHCNILQRFGRLFYEGPMPVAWSPVKKRERPMYKILVSFHAFGNILLFFRALRDAAAVDEDWYERNARTYEGWLAEMGDTLDGCETLTPLGRCLWRPLAEQIAKEPSHA